MHVEAQVNKNPSQLDYHVNISQDGTHYTHLSNKITCELYIQLTSIRTKQ